MRTARLAIVVFLSIVVAACAGSTEPTPSPSPVIGGVGPGGQPNPGGPGGVNAGGGQGGTSGGGGAGGAGGAGGPGGGGNNSVTREWSETVEVNDVGVRSVIHQEYRAVAHLTLTGENGSWAFTGSADITAAFTSDYTGRMADLLGQPCNVHYTDDATASGTVQVEGGIEARDGFYQFTLSIPGIETGTNDTLRDDSACGGPKTTEATPWSAAPITAGGSGEYTGTSMSGSESTPRQGGSDSVRWSFTLPN